MAASLSDWAIVIGLNCYEYSQSLPCLKGAVPDALRISDWLINKANVEPQKIRRILSPCHDNEIPPGTNCVTPGTRADILEAIRKILSRSQGTGRRLYFYYAGHGLNIKDSHLNEQLLLPYDFDPHDPVDGISLSSVRECLIQLRFKEVYYFVDACRFYDKKTEHIGGLNCEKIFPNQQPSSIQGEKAEEEETPEEFVFLATAPMSGAIDNRKGATGAFTEVLLAGLNGCGSAKRYHEKSRTYIVRPLQLSRYIRKELKKKAPEMEQKPHYNGWHSNDPELAIVPEKDVQNEKLRVSVSPPELYRNASVYVTKQKQPIQSKNPMSMQPEEFTLQPDEYSLNGSAQGFRQAEDDITVDLYESLEKVISFNAKIK